MRDEVRKDKKMNMQQGPLGKFLKEKRLARGLDRAGQLARRMRPDGTLDSISRLGGRIRAFEEEGVGDRELLDQMVAVLGIPAEETAPVVADEQRFRETQENERRRAWMAWADEPVRPYLVVRLIPSVYCHRDAPSEVVTLAEAEAWVASVRRLDPIAKGCRTCLVFDRRLRVWYNERGEVEHRTVATPDDAGVPYVQLARKRLLFSARPPHITHVR